MKHFFRHKKLYTAITDVTVIAMFPILRLVTWLMMFISRGKTCAAVKFGFLCSGCGGTRYVHEFTSGNFYAAYGYNKYAFLVGVYLLIALFFLNLFSFFNLKFAGKIFNAMMHWRSMILIVIGYIIFGIVRNFI